VIAENNFVHGNTAINNTGDNIHDINAAGINKIFNNNGDPYVEDKLVKIKTKTADYNIESEDHKSTFTNNGASSIITGTLPPATTPGETFTFSRNSGTYAHRVAPDGTDTIRGGAAGKYLSLDANGGTVTLQAVIGAVWEIVASNGTIGYEP
jgi:hypothetical protein